MSIRDRAAESTERADWPGEWASREEFIAAARADVPYFAGAVLRLTGEEMRRAIVNLLVAEPATDTHTRCISASDKIMELLLVAAEG